MFSIRTTFWFWWFHISGCSFTWRIIWWRELKHHIVNEMSDFASTWTLSSHLFLTKSFKRFFTENGVSQKMFKIFFVRVYLSVRDNEELVDWFSWKMWAQRKRQNMLLIVNELNILNMIISVDLELFLEKSVPKEYKPVQLISSHYPPWDNLSILHQAKNLAFGW